MRVVLTRGAGRQLDAVLDYIEDKSPAGARNVQLRLNEVIHLLEDYPFTGQSTNRPGVRRMVLSPYPYIVFYRVKGSDVIIQRIRHAARKPL